MEKIEIPFDTFEDAMSIHKKLFTMIREKRELYLEDLFPMIATPKDLQGYGWNNLQDCKVTQSSNDEWLIIMPELINLKKEND